MATLKPVPFPHEKYGMFYVEEDLRDAAYRGDVQRMKTLLEQHPKLDVNAMNEYGETALYIACKKNQNKAADFLLEKADIKPNIQTILGNSPLLICAWNDNTELAKKLIAKGADINARTNPDREYHGNVSALDIAQERNNTALVEHLQKLAPAQAPQISARPS